MTFAVYLFVAAASIDILCQLPQQNAKIGRFVGINRRMGVRALVFLIFSKKRRQRLVHDAERSRHDELNRAASICIVIVYNLIGLLDIVSTTLALAMGGAEEANPVLRYMMENAGAGWIAGKLFLQAAVSLMVLWFPHRYVLILFTMAVLLNGAVVINNFQIVAESGAASGVLSAIGDGATQTAVPGWVTFMAARLVG